MERLHKDNLVVAAEAVNGSQRHLTLNAQIEAKAAQSKDEEFWREEVFSGLAFRNFNDFLLLRKAREDDIKLDNASLIAFYTRNLLEIAIWAEFCTKSDKNARRFYQEAGIDALDLLTKMREFCDDEDSADAAIHQLKKRAERKGVDVDQPYMRMHNVANEVGMGTMFARANKLLSKTAHPTALHIVSAFEPAGMTALKDSFYGQACILYLRTIELLESRYGIETK